MSPASHVPSYNYKETGASISLPLLRVGTNVREREYENTKERGSLTSGPSQQPGAFNPHHYQQAVSMQSGSSGGVASCTGSSAPGLPSAEMPNRAVTD